MAVEWIGNKPGTFVNESTVVPLDADNMNAIVRTLNKVTEGGKDSGLDADFHQGKELKDLAKVSDEDLSIYISFDKKSYAVGDFERNKLLNDNVDDFEVIGSETIATSSGISGRSAIFNGASYFQGTYENSGPVSVSFWYKGTTTDAEKIISAYRISSDYRVCVGVNLGKLVFSWKNASNSNLEIISDTSINDGNFHHICCIHDESAGYLYIDGILETQLAGTLATSTNNTLRIGANVGETPTIMNGHVDELKIYKRALSSFEAYGLFFNPLSNKEYNTDVENNPNTVVERDENGSVKSTSTFIENIELKRKTDNVDSAITIGSTEAEVALNINTNVQIDDNSIITDGSNITLPATGTLVTEDGEETLTNKTLTLPKINSEVEITATSEELNSLNEISGNIQDQLDDKAPLESPAFTGAPTGPDTALDQDDEQLVNAKSLKAQIANDIDHLNVFKEWDETYSYSLNEPTFYEGVPYKSLANNNTGNTPSSSTSFWEVTGGGGNNGDGSTTGVDLLGIGEVGTRLSVSDVGTPSLASLNSTDVAFIDTINTELRTYRFNGTSWLQIGDGLSVSGASYSALTALNSTDVAFIDSGNRELRTYRFDGTSWSQVGYGRPVNNVGIPALAALSSTHVALIDGTSGQLRTYRFDGTGWAPVGTDLSVSAGIPALAALNSTDVAFIDYDNKELRTYRFSGNSWSQIGDGLSVSGALFPSLATLNSTDVAFIDHINKELGIYRFDGTAWTQVGASLSISGSYPVIAALNLTDVALVTYGSSELRTYRFLFSHDFASTNIVADFTVPEITIGKSIVVRRASAYDGDPITIFPPSGATFEGLSSLELYDQYSYVELERISETVFAIKNESGRLLTKDQRDALVGTNGTPSENNPYVTEASIGVDVAPLEDGVVPSTYLPSYVDDVLEFANQASFPVTGEASKIYVAIDTNLTFRWSGSEYVEISKSLALGETSATAYRGDRGKTAYDHSQSAHAPADADNTRTAINSAGEKTTPVDADAFPILDSMASNALKKMTLANVKAVLKDYFDGFYSGGGGGGSTGVDLLGIGEVGSGLSINSASYPALAALNSTDVAFIDSDFDSRELRTYRFNGTTWSQVGTGLYVGGISLPRLAALNSTDVTFIDMANKELRTYTFNGTTWSQKGNGLSIGGMNHPALTALNSTDVAFIDSNNMELRTYTFNGTTWSQKGNGLSINSASYSALAALNSTDVAFVEAAYNKLRTYRFNGTTWSQVGNDFSLGVINFPALASLSSTDVAFIDGTSGQLRTYRFDGTNWFQKGTGFSLGAVTYPALATLNSTDVAFIDATNDELRTYRFMFGYDFAVNELAIGKSILIRRTSAYNGSPETIYPPSGATFEGRASISLYGQYSFVELERISETVFAIKDLKDEYVWDSGTGARIRRRWGQLSEKEIIGTTAATANAATSLAHGLDLTKIVSATGMVRRSANYTPMPYLGYGDFINTVSFYCESTLVYVLNTTNLNVGYFSQPYTIVIRYSEW